MIVSAKKLKKNDNLFVAGKAMVVRKVKKTKLGLTISLSPRSHKNYVFKLYVPKHFTVRTAI